MKNHNSISSVLSMMKAKIKVDRPSWMLTGWKYESWKCAKFFFEYAWYTLVIYSLYKLLF